MSSWARKIVEMIQHSMLGSLASAVSGPLLPIFMFWLASRDTSPDFVWPLVLVLLSLWVGAWLLGHLARAPAKSSPLQRVSQQTSNGFEVWDIVPKGGLRPSPLMRSVVLLVGRKPGSRSFFIEALIFLAAFFLVIALMLVGDDQWGRLHPLLVDSAARAPLWVLAALLLTITSLRRWATDQRRKLSPAPTALPEIA